MNSTENTINELVAKVAALEDSRKSIYWVIFLIIFMLSNLYGNFCELKEIIRHERSRHLFDIEKWKNMEKGLTGEEDEVKVKDE